jgi:1-aminocyclopropane-1-carboxylate deaminase
VMNIAFRPSEIQRFSFSADRESKPETSVLREDMIHPFIQGNKWRKLKYNLADFRSSGKKIILTFGGAYSNHLIATADACRLSGIPSIAVIRGEETDNPNKRFLESAGMKIVHVNRTDYRQKTESRYLKGLMNELTEKRMIDDPESVFIIPEGGSNIAAVRGVGEINAIIPEEFTSISCAAGTGATAAGISAGLSPHQKLHVVPVLKSREWMEERIADFGGKTENISIHHGYEFGGYAKTNPGLMDFCNMFSLETGVPVEPVYTGKLFYAIRDLIRNNYFAENEKILIIHTGGIFDFSQSAH